MKKPLLIAFIVGCSTEPEENSTCILVDDDFGICTEELNEAECYSFSSYPSPFLHILWSNTHLVVNLIIQLTYVEYLMMTLMFA